MIDIKKRYAPPVTTGLSETEKLAMDSALEEAGYFNLIEHCIDTVAPTMAPQFPGYAVLAGLQQNQIIRSGVEMLADEMTRKWIRLTGDTITELNRELKRWNVQRLFRDAFALTGYFGGCLIYIDTLGEYATEAELKSPLIYDDKVFPRSALRSLRLIEPFNVSPGAYQCSDPLRADYFCPRYWYVHGRAIHASRFLYFAHNRPSTLFLPAYNFFGMPISQLVLDAVTHFTSTRESTARALKKYGLTVLKTPMAGLEAPGALDKLLSRVDMLVRKRDNDGIEIIDSENENIETVVSPISGMTDIVRQAMDVVAAAFGEPCVKLWGITPSGLNSSGDVDLANHYDNIAALQEAVFRPPLKQLMNVLMWNSSGQLDSTIDFTFAPLGALNEQTKSTLQKERAQIDQLYLQTGVLKPEEVRGRLIKDRESGYDGLEEVNEVAEEQRQ